jgi:tetratricopeptide (TPR) repeat protein
VRQEAPDQNVQQDGTAAELARLRAAEEERNRLDRARLELEAAQRAKAEQEESARRRREASETRASEVVARANTQARAITQLGQALSRIIVGNADAPDKQEHSTKPAASEPIRGAVIYNEGVDRLEAGDKPGAEARFLTAVKQNPALSPAWHALAILAYEKKDWPLTIEYGQNATNLDPSLSDVYGVMAWAGRETGDIRAREWQAKYEQASQELPEVIYNQAVDAINQKRMADAEALLLRAVKAKPAFALAHFWLGMVSFELNKKAAAKEHLEKYLELEPNGSEATKAQELLPLLK